MKRRRQGHGMLIRRMRSITEWSLQRAELRENDRHVLHLSSVLCLCNGAGLTTNRSFRVQGFYPDRSIEEQINTRGSDAIAPFFRISQSENRSYCPESTAIPRSRRRWLLTRCAGTRERVARRWARELASALLFDNSSQSLGDTEVCTWPSSAADHWKARGTRDWRKTMA